MTAAALSTSIAGIPLKNPVGTASGTFGYGHQFEGFYDVASTLGAITCKGVAALPWEGNPAPRITETSSGIINSVGLANPGAEAFARDYGEGLSALQAAGCAVIVQAVGHSSDEFIAALEALDELCPWASAFEINVSCPNLADGGAIIGSTPEAAEALIKLLRPRTNKPLFVKLAPHRVPEIARAVEAAGADAISLINTFPAMSLDVHSRESLLSRISGGLSGPAIHPIALKLCYDAAEAVSIPINAMGGVSSWEDAAEMILVGATMVSVGTANLTQPLVAQEIVTGLESWVFEQGVSSIEELRGALAC